MTLWIRLKYKIAGKGICEGGNKKGKEVRGGGRMRVKADRVPGRERTEKRGPKTKKEKSGGERGNKRVGESYTGEGEKSKKGWACRSTREGLIKKTNRKEGKKPCEKINSTAKSIEINVTSINGREEIGKEGMSGQTPRRKKTSPGKKGLKTCNQSLQQAMSRATAFHKGGPKSSD